MTESSIANQMTVKLKERKSFYTKKYNDSEMSQETFKQLIWLIDELQRIVTISVTAELEATEADLERAVKMLKGLGVEWDG